MMVYREKNRVGKNSPNALSSYEFVHNSLLSPYCPFSYPTIISAASINFVLSAGFSL